MRSNSFPERRSSSLSELTSPLHRCQLTFIDPSCRITPVQDLSGVPTTARKSNLDCRAEFLIDGLEHAGNLTKTAIIDQLPTEVQRVADSVEIKPTIHDSVRMTILRDQLYEYRPYKCETKPMTLTRLIESCQLMAGGEMAVDNMVTRNTYFSLPIRRAHRTLSFETTLDQVVWRKPSSSKNYNLANPEALQAEVPSIAPLAFDASLFGNAEDIPLNYRKYSVILRAPSLPIHNPLRS